MWRVVGLLGAILAVVLTTLPKVPVQAAQPTVARSECAHTRQALIDDDKLDQATRDRVRQESDTDCDTAILRPGRPFVANTTGCHGYYQEEDFTSGGWLTVAKVNVNVGLCFNSGHITVDWGPDCPTSSLPGIVSGHDWCGVWHAGQAQVQPGSNWWYAPAPVWFSHMNHWMRYQINSDGSGGDHPWGG